MPLFSVNESAIRSEKLRDFEKLLASVAEAARNDTKTGAWTTCTTAIGPFGVVQIVMQSESFAAQAKIEPGDQLFRRLFGERKGNEPLQSWLECVSGGRLHVLRDRPELSYPAPRGRPRAFIMLTRLQAIPGGGESLEEFLRRYAEAIPKTDDPRRFVTLQPYFGNLREYATAVALDHPEQLDAMASPAELLTQAFGAAEGGLISRTGLCAIESAARELLVLREDLSHIV